jgi:N-acyl homoserine lactone hydrolase
VLLSGDLAHPQENWKRRLVPTINHDRARTVASIVAADELMTREGGTVWIQHDREQIETLIGAGSRFG